MGYNYPFQPQSAVVQHQDKKQRSRRWIIAVVVVLIIASIGGFYLHWNSTYPTLRTSYSGNVGTLRLSSGGYGLDRHHLLDQVVEDHTHGTFTGHISASDGCRSLVLCRSTRHRHAERECQFHLR